jgi:hypothetical protein
MSIQRSRNLSLVLNDSLQGTLLLCVCLPLNKKLQLLVLLNDENHLLSSPYKGRRFSQLGEYCVRCLLKKESSLGKQLISLKINYSECRFRYRLQGEIIELVFQA